MFSNVCDALLFQMAEGVVVLVFFVFVIHSAFAVDFLPEKRPTGDPLLPMCEPGAAIPDDLISCGTCSSKCGTKTDPSSVDRLFSGQPCSCDTFCGFSGDCCRDFAQFCPDEFQNFQMISEQHPFQRSPQDFQCINFEGEFGRRNENLMIDTCTDGSPCRYSRSLNEDPNTFVPMYDSHRGVHYVSGHCAMCNGATGVKLWGASLFCQPVPGPQEYKEKGVVDSPQTLTEVVDTASCELQYSQTGESRPCRYVTSRCQTSCQNENLIRLCESGPQDMVRSYATFGVFKNPHCAVCNGVQSSTTGDIVCGIISDRNFQESMKPFFPDSFSLTMVFDFDPRRGLTVGKHPPAPECNTREVYVPAENKCRLVSCPPGQVVDESESSCIPEPTNVTAVVTGTFRTEPSMRMMKAFNHNESRMEEDIAQVFSATLEYFNVTKAGVVNVDIHIERHNEELRVQSNILCNCDYRNLLETARENPEKIRDFRDKVADDIREVVTKYIFAARLNPGSITAYAVSHLNISHLNSTAASDTERPNCTWLVYQANETEFANGSVTVVSTGRTYAPGKYQFLDQMIIVCELYLDEHHEVNKIDFVLSVLTLVCIGISIVCLVVRVILQNFISSFQNRPGRIQLQMVVALLFAFILLIIGPMVSSIPEACTTAAVLLAYGFLAAFVWMNIIAADTWLVFRPSSAFSRADEEGKSLIVHMLLGWGIPALLVAVPIVMNFVDGVNEHFRPDFGGPRCWFTERYAMLVYFGVPIALSLLLNIFLYVHTSVNLHKALKNAALAAKAEKYHFGIYVRLFVLMGITWIFGFISAFTNQIVIDFIFVVLTALQGLFLFISFVCNRRVLSEVGQKVKSDASSSSYGKKTKSTPLQSYEVNSRSETSM